MSTEDHSQNTHNTALPTPEELLDGRAPRPAAPDRGGYDHQGKVPASEPSAGRKKRRGCVWALLMMLIVAVGVTAAVLDVRKRSRPDPTIRTGSMCFEVQRFTIRNETLGSLTVITGFVKNQGLQTRVLRITATLYDEKGVLMAQKTDWAGLALTDKQLHLLPKEDLEAALHAAHAIKVPPDDEIPFTMIFYPDLPRIVGSCDLTADGP